MKCLYKAIKCIEQLRIETWCCSTWTAIPFLFLAQEIASAPSLILPFLLQQQQQQPQQQQQHIQHQP